MRVVVTGTDTGVGKTYVSAALPTVDRLREGGADRRRRRRATVRALSGAEVHTLARYPEPLAPEPAAARAGVPCITPREIADFVRAARPRRVVVEGAGGLLVRFGERDDRRRRASCSTRR